MRSTTGSKLAEQSYKDFMKETAPTDKKAGAAFMFNEYARVLGLPLRLAAAASKRFVNVCHATLMSLHRTHEMPANPANINERKLAVSTRWLAGELAEAWGL